jgi:hypothetical protein
LTAQEYKGWLYRTAHGRRVDAHLGVYNDGHVFVEVPSGWEVCPPIDDLDIRRVVVESYIWGSKFLTFDNGDEYTAGGGSRYGGIPDHIKRDQSGRVAAFASHNDVLLRKRA